MEYQVDLEVFHGPLDLLLYLVKRDEIDLRDIPIARVAEQFKQYLDVLQVIDVERVGDFLVMAATLAELKSRMLLPRPEEAGGQEEDPRQELVRQLPRMDAVFIAVGGGGLIGGVGAYLKSVSPATQIVGCWPENSPILQECLNAGRIFEVPEKPTISESTAGNLEPVTPVIARLIGTVPSATRNGCWPARIASARPLSV